MKPQIAVHVIKLTSRADDADPSHVVAVTNDEVGKAAEAALVELYAAVGIDAEVNATSVERVD